MTKIHNPSANPEADRRYELDGVAMVSLASELSARDMFCLHGIALDSVGRNSLLPESTTLEERFQTVIENRPAIATSVHTSRAATSKAPLWSSVGVIVGDGRIQAASPHDMGSVMLPDGRRSTPVQSASDVRMALDKIVENDAKYPDYPLNNEVVVNDPVAAGLYFKDTAGLMPHQINRQHVTADYNTVPELIRNCSAAYGLPIFAIRTSGIYQVKTLDPVTGRYEFSSDTAPRVRPAGVVAAVGSMAISS